MQNNDNIQWLSPELPEQPISVNPELWALLREFRSLRNRYFCIAKSLNIDDETALSTASDLFTDLDSLLISYMSGIIADKILE